MKNYIKQKEKNQRLQTHRLVCFKDYWFINTLLWINFNLQIVTYRIWRISDPFRLDANIVTDAFSNTTGALPLSGESKVSPRACSVFPTNCVSRRPWASSTNAQTVLLHVCNVFQDMSYRELTAVLKKCPVYSAEPPEWRFRLQSYAYLYIGNSF